MKKDGKRDLLYTGFFGKQVIKNAVICWTAFFVLYKFLPVSGVVQAKDDKEDRGNQHVHPAMENRVEKYLRVFINGNIVGIQENIPLAIPDSSLYHGE